jgi:uncharacterized protein YndB with AHSA1/START domain
MKSPRTDRIERQILLRAPRSRVWLALTDWKQFSRWFGVDMEGPFTPGARVAGKVMHPEYAHLLFDIVVDRVEPEGLFAWRWIPGAMEPGVDYSGHPTTLVTFTLEETADGTLLTVVESGFDGLPPDERPKAYRQNSDGWDEQMANVERYVGQEV